MIPYQYLEELLKKKMSTSRTRIILRFLSRLRR
jgi:hypothetical protein